jgi:hypothetical protein
MLTGQDDRDSHFVISKIKLIHVGLGRWGLDWARHAYPDNIATLSIVEATLRSSSQGGASVQIATLR